jgi:hypothetical protein
LTFAVAHSMIPPKGGDWPMKGSVQYHPPARRWYISWYPHRIWKDPVTFKKFYSEEHAKNILERKVSDGISGIS